MATSKSGAGGKIVTYRRKGRLSAPPTPYDRPPPPESPNWFSGVVAPSARAIASGAGKILTFIFSDSDTSSSEGEEYASEDDIVNENHEIPCYRGNTSNEKIVTSSEMMHYRKESRLSVWSSETKWIIEQLIMKETFSREECDRLIKLLYSRIVDWSTEADESSVARYTKNADTFDKGVQETKRWLQAKKVGSMTELAHGTSNLNSLTPEHLESGGGSPVDLARSYMKSRPPWAFLGKDIELNIPLAVSMKHFQEETLYSAGQYSLSASKEELLLGLSRATEDMLCIPSTTTDASHFTVAQMRMESPGTGGEGFAMRERMTEPQSPRLHRPIDALVYAGVTSLTESRKDGKPGEALPFKPDNYVCGNNEVPEAVQEDAEYIAWKLICPSSPNYAERLHSDMHLSNANCSPAIEETEFGSRGSANDPSSSQVSLSMAKHDDGIGKQETDEKAVNIISVEGNCELYMNSLCVQYEEGSDDIGGPFRKKTAVRKQQGRKPSKYYRRRGRKPSKHNRKGRGW